MLSHFFGVISVTEVEFGSQAMMFSKIFVILTRVIISSRLDICFCRPFVVGVCKV